ncbi:hypothetical protein PPMP20_18825 [Paraburkholderia phymatum]|uniref:Uncharacterized protein n=1 Tax=Paraburkholderia phymatum (strain DSM 17167 / CIP 108236 / LMG 21445 / STM815) TaxID=391038 RepID=B2JU66_PARP8|nr:hypothetical protein [Paraburkholderia phymatum]ACC76119.1 hypothetical protein Bphy_7118 [Paraburkholderia phymatum STM815]
MNGNRISWKPNEQTAVANEVHRIWQRDPTVHIVAAVDQAQRMVLDADRHRNLRNARPNELRPWLDRELEQIKAIAERRAAADSLFSALPTAKDVVMLDDAAPSSSEPAAIEAPAIADAAATDEAVTDEPAPAPKARKTMTHWRDHEQRAIVEKALDLMERWPDIKLLEAFRKAQPLVIETERQRDLDTWARVSRWAEPLIELVKLDRQIAAAREHEERERIDRERAELAEREAAQQARRDAEAREREEQEAAAQRAFDERVEAEVQTRMHALPFESLIRTFAVKVAREAITAFSDELQSSIMSSVVTAATEAVQRADTTPTTDEASHLVVRPTNRLPRVGVVGLLNQQEQDIERAFKGRVSFVFVKSQHEGGNAHGGHGMLEKCRTCDLVISMTDHVGADVAASSKKLHVPFKEIGGKVSALKSWLNEWLDGGIALKAA